MNNKNLVYISVDKLYPHPENPRKELGDLTELAESIKTNGVMQNLTVVPKDDDTYTVIIGHRRLEASKIAGVEEVPCVISDINYKEQIAAMVMENMQRSDLTVYEEACGIQLMLDLGDNIETVSNQTGLSKSTIRKRVKLLSLDEKKVQSSIKRGATLFDFEKLDKIKDATLKDKVLDNIGTANFDNELKKALNVEENKDREAKFLEIIDTFAKRVEDTSNLKLTDSIFITSRKEYTAPEDADKLQYYYKYMGNSWIGIYRDKTADELNDDIRRNEQRMKKEKQNAVIDEMSKRFFELRKEFIEYACILSKEETEILMRFAYVSILKNQNNYKNITDDEFSYFAGIKKEDAPGVILNIMSGDYSMQAKKALLIMSYANFHDSEHEKYSNYNNTHIVNEKLEIIYDFIEQLGYKCSDEERSWRDGTHEIFSASEE